jgi:hypothetical protein
VVPSGAVYDDAPPFPPQEPTTGHVRSSFIPPVFAEPETVICTDDVDARSVLPPMSCIAITGCLDHTVFNTLTELGQLRMLRRTPFPAMTVKGDENTSGKAPQLACNTYPTPLLSILRVGNLAIPPLVGTTILVDPFSNAPVVPVPALMLTVTGGEASTFKD